MNLDKVISSIDAEIALLKQARALLSSDGMTAPATKSESAPPSKKRRMSAAGRKRIAEAQRKRWAALKKAKTS